jgi:hypothetical protein
MMIEQFQIEEDPTIQSTSDEVKIQLLPSFYAIAFFIGYISHDKSMFDLSYISLEHLDGLRSQLS